MREVLNRSEKSVASQVLQLDYMNKPIAVRAVGFDVKFLDELQQGSEHYNRKSCITIRNNDIQQAVKVSDIKFGDIRESIVYQGLYEVDLNFNHDNIKYNKVYYLFKSEDRYLIVGEDENAVGANLGYKHWQNQFHSFHSDDLFSACLLKDNIELFHSYGFSFAIESNKINRSENSGGIAVCGDRDIGAVMRDGEIYSDYLMPKYTENLFLKRKSEGSYAIAQLDSAYKGNFSSFLNLLEGEFNELGTKVIKGKEYKDRVFTGKVIYDFFQNQLLTNGNDEIREELNKFNEETKIKKEDFYNWLGDKFETGMRTMPNHPDIVSGKIFVSDPMVTLYQSPQDYLNEEVEYKSENKHNEIVLSYNNNKNPIKLILPKRTNDNEEQEDIQRGKALAEFLSHNGNDVTLVEYDDNNFAKNKKHKFYSVLENGKEITIQGKDTNPFIYKEETPQPPTSIIKPQPQFPYFPTPETINGRNYTLYKDPSDTENNTAFRTGQKVEIANNNDLDKIYYEAFAFSLKETNKKLQKLKLTDITVKDALSIYKLKIENPEKLTTGDLEVQFKNCINKDSMLNAYKSLGYYYQQFMEGKKIYTGREENLETVVGKRIKRMGIDFFDKLKERLTAEVK